MAPPVGGYSFWLDASQIAGQADNTALTTWNDLSANGNNFTQASGAAKPVYYSSTSGKTINGLPAVWFNGSQWMNCVNSVAQAQPFTWYVVAKLAGTLGANTYTPLASASPLCLFSNAFSSQKWQIFAGATGTSTINGDANSHVLYGLFNGSSSILHVDGTASAALAAGTNAMGGTPILGSQTTAGSNQWNGAICEVIAYPSAVTGANDTAIFNYLNNKWLVAPTAVNGTASVTVGPLTVAAATTTETGGCGRTAWLALGSQTLLLEDPNTGYFCTSLDLGYPTVRDVVTNRPDNTGATDRTQLFGPRVVNAQIEALQGAGAVIDAVAAMFAPFMNPGARPQLHYVLDRPGQPERVLTVRAAGYSWPVAGPYQRDIQLQFVAADPVAYDPAVRTVTDLPGGGSTTIFSAGDLPVRPLFRITGPVTAPDMTLTPSTGPVWHIRFLPTFTIAAGHYVDIDTNARTVLADSDPAQPRLSSLDWTLTSWQWIPAGMATFMAFAGTATSGATQVQAFWQDGYLT